MLEKLKLWLNKNWFMTINYSVYIVIFAIFFGRPDVVFAEVLITIWLLFALGKAIYKWFNKNKI